MALNPGVRRLYVIALGEEHGPFDLERLAEELAAGRVQPGDQVRTGMGTPMGTVAEVMRLAEQQAELAGHNGLTDISGSRIMVLRPVFHLFGSRRWMLPAAVAVAALILMVALSVMGRQPPSASPALPAAAAPAPDPAARPAVPPVAVRKDPAGTSDPVQVRPVPQPVQADPIATLTFDGRDAGWSGGWSSPAPVLAPRASGGHAGTWTATGTDHVCSVRRLEQRITDLFWLTCRMDIPAPRLDAGIILLGGDERLLFLGLLWRPQLHRWEMRPQQAELSDRKVTYISIPEGTSRLTARLLLRCAVQDDRTILHFWVDPPLDREPVIDKGRQIVVRSRFACDGVGVSFMRSGDRLTLEDLVLARTWKTLVAELGGKR
jgi:hypothetical protein